MRIKDLKAIIANLPDDMEVLADSGHDLPSMGKSENYKYGVRELLAIPERIVKHPHFGNLAVSRACIETKGARKCLVL